MIRPPWKNQGQAEHGRERIAIGERSGHELGENDGDPGDSQVTDRGDHLVQRWRSNGGDLPLRSSGGANDRIDRENEDDGKEWNGRRGEDVLVEADHVAPSRLRPERAGELATGLNQRQESPERDRRHAEGEPDREIEAPAPERSGELSRREGNEHEDR